MLQDGAAKRLGEGGVTTAVNSSSQLFASSNAVKESMLNLREIQITLNDPELAESKTESKTERGRADSGCPFFLP